MILDKNLLNNPFENCISDGGLCKIFRTICCVGDSLSSGEFEIINKDGQKEFYDCYEYSWGQYMARETGANVYNFSHGGMSAKWYCESYAQENDFWNANKAAQAYIIALGVNDISNCGEELGGISDIDFENWQNNKKNFIGYYAQIIQRYKEIQPAAKFFLVTMPHSQRFDREKAEDIHAELMYQLAKNFTNTYVVDFRKFAPVYDNDFKAKYYLNSHLNVYGYILTCQMMLSYIDYIIKENADDFIMVPLMEKKNKINF